MIKESILFYKILVISVIILFAGVAVQPGIASFYSKGETDVEPKDYLFNTIIDIANNPDIKNIFKHNNYQIFSSDYEYKRLFSQISFKRPGLLFGTLFTKPSTTYDYLDKCYNKGIEITNIVGEDKALEMIESIKVIDTRVFDELNESILNNGELSDRLVLLQEMNKEYVSSGLSLDFPIICSILVILLLVSFIPYEFLLFLFEIFRIFNENSIISDIIYFVMLPYIYIVIGIPYLLLGFFKCGENNLLY